MKSKFFLRSARQLPLATFVASSAVTAQTSCARLSRRFTRSPPVVRAAGIMSPSIPMETGFFCRAQHTRW